MLSGRVFGYSRREFDGEIDSLTRTSGAALTNNWTSKARVEETRILLRAHVLRCSMRTISPTYARQSLCYGSDSNMDTYNSWSFRHEGLHGHLPKLRSKTSNQNHDTLSALKKKMISSPVSTAWQQRRAILSKKMPH